MAGPHHEPLVAPEPGSSDRTPISVGPSLLCFAWKPPGQKLLAPLSSGGERGWPGHQQRKKAESALQTVKHLAWWFLFSGLRLQECRVVWARLWEEEVVGWIGSGAAHTSTTFPVRLSWFAIEGQSSEGAGASEGQVPPGGSQVRLRQAHYSERTPRQSSTWVGVHLLTQTSISGLHEDMRRWALSGTLATGCSQGRIPRPAWPVESPPRARSKWSLLRNQGPHKSASTFPAPLPIGQSAGATLGLHRVPMCPPCPLGESPSHLSPPTWHFSSFRLIPRLRCGLPKYPLASSSGSPQTLRPWVPLSALCCSLSTTVSLPEDGLPAGGTPN